MEVQVRRPERGFSGEQDGALQHVAQLAHVAGPAVVLQLLHRRGGEAQVAPPLGTEALQHLAGEHGDVVAPFV